MRSAHIADIDSNEFVYFAAPEDLSSEKLDELIDAAWNTGLSKVHPHEGHRNSDISLIIFTKALSPETAHKITKTKLYKSYKFSFHGWSHFKLTVCNVSDMCIFSNRHGKDFAKLIKKNLKNPL